MDKIRLAILDDDKIYAERLIKVCSEMLANELEIYIYSNVEQALKQLKLNRIDVLLSTEAYQIDKEQMPVRCALAYLAESNKIEKIFDQKAICKYQRVDVLYKEIAQIYAENIDNIKNFKSGNAGSNIILFMSASGGVGATSAAVACAINIAKAEKKVLYLNLQNLGNSDLYFNGPGNMNFGEVIYAVKSKKSNFSLILENTAKKDETGVMFYSPSKTPLDVTELTADDIEVLLDELSKNNLFDYIVLDTDTLISPRMIKILKKVYSIVLVSDGSDVSNDRMKKLYEAFEIIEERNELDILSVLNVIYNKFDQGTGNTVLEDKFNMLGKMAAFRGATNKDVIDEMVRSNLCASLY